MLTYSILAMFLAGASDTCVMTHDQLAAWHVTYLYSVPDHATTVTDVFQRARGSG